MQAEAKARVQPEAKARMQAEAVATAQAQSVATAPKLALKIKKPISFVIDIRRPEHPEEMILGIEKSKAKMALDEVSETVKHLKK